MINVIFRSQRQMDGWQTVSIPMRDLEGAERTVGYVRNVPLLGGMWLARTDAIAADGPLTNVHRDRTAAARWLILVTGMAKSPGPELEAAA